MLSRILFTKPFITGKELYYIAPAVIVAWRTFSRGHADLLLHSFPIGKSSAIKITTFLLLEN
jgi:hypothetical protein